MKLTDNLYLYSEKGALDCNTYVIKGEPGIIVDAGSLTYLPSLAQDMHADGIAPEDIGIIVNTHLHGDHCGANKGFRDLSGARISLHPVQKQNYEVTVVDTARLFGLPAVHVEEDELFKDSTLNAGDMEFEFIHSPGHSLDSICFYCEKEKVLICGDVIFQGNIGRVDLPGGDAEQLVESIERLSHLDIEYVLPGHMGIVADSASVKRNFEFVKESILKWL